ncbi:hypothetical protein [Propionicimonas sp.]|uniref:hypothetical protein n=1 Tax=Propionicimonas sp. TaxID=1955623 RepID=UPI0017D4E22D|nr:hypothetical protein [Propionicimonas sp.]MBU3975598.1 hypothetical protein [Actinomycetota bacterium]MBA3019999.1 hypothetical protein [Propionicimonas sp.]MBU3986253.1 hypothetical protein [Actinomycetota bacterium]MBU4007822.1 hypothetical protein [Actinomycetota bacterium]MBU4064080.1 hypothetical protein [Actinomycetota bacterium]
MMEMPRRLINLIGAAVVVIIIVAGTLLVAAPLFSSAVEVSTQAAVAQKANEVMRELLSKRVEQNAKLGELNTQLATLRGEIPADSELRDASALVSAAAKASGARVQSITFGEPKVFVAPTGGGMSTDGKPNAKQENADANTPTVQIPVTFEAEVSSASQAAAFVDGLRAGPRQLQVVEAVSSPTNNAKRFTVTVDALVFAAKG